MKDSTEEAFFVSKKRYAVIEDGEIIAKGLELVRRDWAPIVKQTQKRRPKGHPKRRKHNQSNKYS